MMTKTEKTLEELATEAAANPRITEEERMRLLDEWQHSPCRNPEFAGYTPAQVARRLLGMEVERK